MVKHAWYSKKQSKVYSECEQWKCKEFVWLDKNNEEVHCTGKMKKSHFGMMLYT